MAILQKAYAWRDSINSMADADNHVSDPGQVAHAVSHRRGSRCAPTFNAASYFVDRHIDEGRGDRVAIECGDERVTYAQLLERVNRFGSALRDQLGVRPEERVLLLLLDEPAFAYAFFGTMKVGAVAVPTNTLLKEADYRHLLSDTRATVLVVSEALVPADRAHSARGLPPAAAHRRRRSARARRFADVRRLLPPVRRSCRPNPRAAMRPRSGCIHPAAPGCRRDACICTTTSR